MATEIHFYHNAPEPFEAACRIAERAVKGGRRLAVRIPDPRQCQRFDQMLWTLDARGFVPHVAIDSPLAAETPVVLGGGAADWPHHDVLLNLGSDTPQEFGSFAMLMEVVADDDESRQAARARWRGYRDQGLTPIAHDLAARNSS